MKKILKIAFSLFFAINTYSQVTVILPLSSFDDTNGAYYKDLDNELLTYEGTWEGVLNNKKYTFVFQKFTQQLRSFYPFSDSYAYHDELKGKFKVTDITTNTIIYSSLNAINYDEFPIFGIVKPYHNRFQFIFTDTDENCSNTLEFYLENIQNQTNQLKYSYFNYDGWWNKDCTTYSDRMDIPVNLPMNELILTKL